MAANLTHLFGSVQGQDGDERGSTAPTTPAPASGESGGGGQLYLRPLRLPT